MNVTNQKCRLKISMFSDLPFERQQAMFSFKPVASWSQHFTAVKRAQENLNSCAQGPFYLLPAAFSSCKTKSVPMGSQRLERLFSCLWLS